MTGLAGVGKILRLCTSFYLRFHEGHWKSERIFYFSFGFIRVRVVCLFYFTCFSIGLHISRNLLYFHVLISSTFTISY